MAFLLRTHCDHRIPAIASAAYLSLVQPHHHHTSAIASATSSSFVQPFVRTVARLMATGSAADEGAPAQQQEMLLALAAKQELEDDDRAAEDASGSSPPPVSAAVVDDPRPLTKKEIRKLNKKVMKAHKRARRAGMILNLKPCDICKRDRDLLVRCQIDDTEKWFMVCGRCWRDVSGGVVDGDAAHPHYRYGGLWKAH